MVRFLPPEHVIQVLGAERVIQILGVERALQILGAERGLDVIGLPGVIEAVGPGKLLHELLRLMPREQVQEMLRQQQQRANGDKTAE